MDPVDAARAVFGDQLRSVIVYGVDEESMEATADIRYVRDDIAAGIDDIDELTARFARDYHFESLEREYQEELRGLGELHASVRVFESAVVVRALDGDRGISVSVDPDGVPSVDAYLARLDD